MDNELEKVLLSKSQMKEDSFPTGPFFSKFKEYWLYSFTSKERSPSLPNVTLIHLPSERGRKKRGRRKEKGEEFG